MFGTGQSNEIAVFKDRIEIYNPGSFPTGITPEIFIQGNSRPVRRNPLITRILYYSKDMESFATGLKRIYTVCKEINYGIFVFEQNANIQSVNIHNEINDLHYESVNVVL